MEQLIHHRSAKNKLEIELDLSQIDLVNWLLKVSEAYTNYSEISDHFARIMAKCAAMMVKVN